MNAFNKYLNNTIKIIGNLNSIVEVDESKFEKRRFNRGHPVGGMWVVDAANRTNRRTILQPVNNINKETLTTFCTKFVDSASTIYTDCWKGYPNLYKHFDLYKTVNHFINFVDMQARAHTNTIEVNRML